MAKLGFRNVRPILVSTIALLGLHALAMTAEASSIYSETLNGNGETRVVTTRTFTAPSSGKYLLTLKNGTRGPRVIEQCYTEDTVEEKRQCLFDNLTEKVDQDFTRVQDALIHVNNIRVRNPLAPNEKTITKTRGLVSIPIDLVMGSNQIKIDYLGYSTARLEYVIEPAPLLPSAPQAFFLLNRITGTTAQAFNLNGRESFSPEGHLLTYTWSWGDEPPETILTPGLVTATHTYETAGTYNAKLKVTDTITLETSEFAIDLVVKAVNPTAPLVNEKPKPVIQYALDSTNSMRVLLDASQSTDDNAISSYSWRITNQAGLHSTVTDQTFNYVFAQPGSYTVRLTVKDDQNLAAATERVISVAPLSTLVADEILFSEKSYFGTVSTEAITGEVLNVPAPTLARIRIKNADGLEHPVEDCGLIAWPTKISCLYTNLVNRTYLSLYRVNLAQVYINGRKVTDAYSLRKQNAVFETVVALNQANTMQVRVRGWPTAFATVEVQSLEENVAPQAMIAMANGVTTQTFSGTPKTLDFTAAGSTDANDQIMSYRFQAKLHGTNEYALDSDWQADPVGSLTFLNPGTYDVQASARDKFGAVGTSTMSVVILSNAAPVITLKYYRVLTGQAPYQVRAEVRATDSDPGDTLQYNFEFSNGQTTGFQNLPRATTTFGSLGSKSVTITVRDLAGATTSTVLAIDLTANILPIAAFTFSPNRAGYAPHTIDFDASNSSDPDGPSNTLRYFWDFGDGSPSVEAKMVTHTFPAGEWIVTLSVLDSNFGLKSLSRAVFGWTDAPPVPMYVFSRVPNSFQINFDASASAPGNSPIVNYRFEFGNGVTQNFATPYFNHTYAAAGVYNTSLRVYDQEGDANIIGQTITVFNGQKPTAGFEMTVSDVVLPAAFTFDAASSASPNSGASLTHFKWTLPDESVVYGPLLYYNTNTHGNFDIKLEVRDSFGFWSDAVTKTFSATGGVLPVAQIQADKTTIALGQPIHLHAYDSYTLNAMANLVSFEWTMPAGNKLYGPSQTITLSSTGLKTISLKVTDSKGYVSNLAMVQVSVQARQNPTAVLALTTSGQMTVPVAGHLSAAGSFTPNPGAVLTGYEWKISAPTTPMPTEFSLFGAEVDMTFNQVTTWTVALRVFDSAGGTSAWASTTFGPTTNTIPVAHISGAGLTDTAPSNIVFNGLGSYDPDSHAIIAWHWLFSDGGDAYGPTPSHYYSAPGTYTVTMRVQDEYWAWSDPVSMTVTILPNQAPLAFLEIEDVPGNRFQKVFKDSGSYDPDGAITGYYWWISGIVGTAGSGQEITYTFPGGGTYEVHLDVYDNKGLLGTNSTSVVITANLHPVGVLHATPSSTVPFRFDFTAAASTDDVSIASYSWDFGDGSTATGVSVSHVYAEQDFYDVTLRLVDNEGAITDVKSTVNAQNYSEQNPTVIISGKEDEPNLETVRAPVSITANSIPAVIFLTGEESVITPRTSAGAVYIWDAGVLGTYEGMELILNVNRVGIFPITLTVTDSDGRSSTSTTQVDTSAAACGEFDGDSICPYVIGRSDNSVDMTASDLKIETGVAYVIDPASITGSHSVSFEDANGESIDASSIATVNGSKIEMPTASLATLLSGHPEPFNGRVSFISDDGQNVGVGAFRGLRLAKKSLSIEVPAGSKNLEVISGNSNFAFRRTVPTSTTVVGVRPHGSYTASVETANGRITTAFEIDDLFGGVVVLSEIESLQSFDQPPSTLSKSSFDQKVHTADGIFDLGSLRLPYVTSLPSLSTKGAQRSSQKSNMSTMTINNFDSFCGEHAPFNIVQVGPTQMPENGQWTKFLSNNLNSLPDPNATLYSPLGSKSIKAKKVSGFCQMQSPTYMGNQYFNWITAANVRCCGADTYCRQQILNHDAMLRQGSHLETANVTYTAEFKDQTTGVTSSSSMTTTFQKAAAKAGYNRNSMSSQIGLPISDSVLGWSVPFEFDLPVPGHISSPMVRVSVKSSYPTQYPGIYGSHFYYCWLNSGPLEFEPILEIVEDATSNGTPGQQNAFNAMTGSRRLIPVSRDDRSTYNFFGHDLAKWDYAPKFKLTARGDYNKPEFNAANTGTLNPRVSVVILGEEFPVGGPVTVTGYACANNACTGRFKFDGGRIFENVPKLQLNLEGIVPGTVLPSAAKLKYAVDMVNSSKTVAGFKEVSHELNYNLGAVTVPGVGAVREPSSVSSYRCDWGYGQPTPGWSTYGKTGLLRYIRDTLKPLQATVDYWLLCNDGARPFGGQYPDQAHAAHQMGQNLDIRPFSPTVEFANEFYETDPGVKSGATWIRVPLLAAKKASAFGVLRTYRLAMDAWPCQEEEDAGCLDGARNTATQCWENFDDDSKFANGACPIPALSTHMELFYTHGTRKNAMYDLIAATQSLRDGLLPLISNSISSPTKHDKILHSDGFADLIPQIAGGVSSATALGLPWNGELIFNGKLLYAPGKSVPLYKLGVQALKTSGCTGNDSKWKLPNVCVNILPFTQGTNYSTEALHIKRVEGHLNHIHVEKYGD